MNKYFGTRICCTDTVVSQCPDLHFRPIGNVILKGKLTGVDLYNPVTDEEAATPLYHRYMAAYALLKDGDPSAAEAVRALRRDYPDDALIGFHFQRVESGLNTHLVVMEDK